MATFLELCKKVNNFSGVHGDMTDVLSTKHLQSKISESVNTAWSTLQVLRKDWTFMIKRHSFNSIQGEEIYAPQSSTEPTVGVDDLGTYMRDGLFLDREKLDFVAASDYPYIDNSIEERPRWFTVEPRTNNLYLDLPDSSYTFDLYYRKSVQDLFEGATPNLNVPELPDSYQNIIIHSALTLFAVFLGNPELYGKSEMEYQRLLGVLMREYLPSKRINQRSLI